MDARKVATEGDFLSDPGLTKACSEVRGRTFDTDLEENNLLKVAMNMRHLQLSKEPLFPTYDA
jgi:hypothetical protein